MIKNKKAFTLIELIIYVSLLSMFISVAILFSWDIIYGSVRTETQQQVTQNLRLASRRIIHEVRNASAINSLSTNDLCLASADSARNPTRIYLNANQINIAWGGGSTDCTSMTNDAPLTTNILQATNLTFTDFSSPPESYNINFSLTLQSTGDRVQWQKSQTFTSSAELRSN